MAVLKLIAIAAFLSAVSAQTTQAPGAQCGGITWKGSTICPSGYVCTYVTAELWQCQPLVSTTKGKTTTTTKTTKTTKTTTKKTTTTSTTKKTSTKTSSTTAVPSTTTQRVTSTTASPTPTVTQATAPQWGQCGGQGFTGPTICPYAFICVVANQFFSQCLPDPSVTTTSRTTSSRTTTSAVPQETISYFFVFGDSYSQTGFDLNGTKPSAENPLGNPPFPGWTTSGGRNWVGYMGSSNALLIYNLASGGATTDAALVTPFAPTVLSFVDQVSQFTSNLVPAPSYANWTSATALFGIWIGVNDVGNAWYRPEWPTLSQQIVNRYFEQVQILYNSGARKFAFLNVPPINRTPAMLLQDVASQQAEAVAIGQFNNLLQAGRDAFVAANPGLTNLFTQVIDTQQPFNTILDEPTVFGAPNASCYNSDGVSCLWWNDYHPGLVIQQLVQNTVSVNIGLYPCCGNTGV